MLLRILQFLFVLFVVRLILRAVAPLWSARRQAEPSPRLATDLVFDAVCSTYLPRDRALVAIVGGKLQHFCSAECRERATALLSPA